MRLSDAPLGSQSASEPPPQPGAAPLLEIHDLCKSFQRAPARLASGTPQRVLQSLHLSVWRGETVGIVGESGCGKTTLARILLRIIEPDSGTICFAGLDWVRARGRELKALRRQMQMVFQDPVASLNPRMRIADLVGEPLAVHEPGLSAAARRERVLAMLAATGLDERVLTRYPHEFSGGQRQRIAIARSLILRPALLIADEPVSALDVSIGAQILSLLAQLQRDFRLTLLLISHSLPVVAQLATRVAVMQEGNFVETGPAQQVLSAPQHPYTQALLAAVPQLG